MASRRNIPPTFTHTSEMIRRDPLIPAQRPMDPQAEIERLAGDNHKLAYSHLAMKHDLIASQREIDELKDYIRSIQTEGDIQIRILLEKIAKMEGDIGTRPDLMKQLEESHFEARRLVEDRAKLTAKIELLTWELERARADVEKLPEAYDELYRLRMEHSQLRQTFDYERAVNTEKVAQMYAMEKDMIEIYEEVERLRAEVLEAEKRANAPPPPQTPPSAPIPMPGGDDDPYMDLNVFYPAPFYGNGGYVDPCVSGGFTVGPPGINGPPVDNVGGI